MLSGRVGSLAGEDCEYTEISGFVNEADVQ